METGEGVDLTPNDIELAGEIMQSLLDEDHEAYGRLTASVIADNKLDELVLSLSMIGMASLALVAQGSQTKMRELLSRVIRVTKESWS